MVKDIDTSERILDYYMRVGAELHLIKILSGNVQDSVRCLTTLPCVRRFNNALSIIYDVCAELEDNMRYDLAQLAKRVALSERDYKAVFYAYSNSHRCTSKTRLRKPKRTIYIYIRASAEFRILKMLISKLYDDASKLLPAPKSDQIKTVANIINKVCSEVETNMFKDFPYISQDCTRLFYGAEDNPAFISIDKQVHKHMKEIIESLLPKLPEE